VDWLKAKIDAGACEAITQFFFEAETFLRFRDACEKAGINAPITPGILPITNWNSARSFAQRCGASVPAWLDQAFEAALRDDRHDLLAKAVCTELCSDLLDEGVETLHFYTLNRPDLTREICHALGVTQAITGVQDVA
jgi:methylenetetrahydrofolate reductase (NADPH)